MGKRESEREVRREKHGGGGGEETLEWWIGLRVACCWGVLECSERMQVEGKGFEDFSVERMYGSLSKHFILIKHPPTFENFPFQHPNFHTNY